MERFSLQSPVWPDSERAGTRPGDENERILIENVTIFNYNLESDPTPSEPGRTPETKMKGF